MDLIYTDADRRDVGVLKHFSLDLAFGSDENDFELTLDVGEHCCQAGCLLYIEETEYGGIIDRIGVVTADNLLTYRGRTWHGILASKVIQPDKDKSHLVVYGEANAVMQSLIERLGLTDLFVASDIDSGIFIDNYQFDRYTDAYSGLKKMLASASGKLDLAFHGGRVVLSALPIVDYSEDEQFDNDQVEMTIEKAYNRVNHLICLGKGELADRQVLHLFVDPKGKIKETRSFTGLQEVVAVYDYPNAESLDELRSDGIKHLKSLANEDKVDLSFASDENTYGIGDIVGAKELITGLQAKAEITKKIVTVNQDTVNIEYKVGE